MPADLEVARVHLWLLIEQRNYLGALDEADRVARQVVKLRDWDLRRQWTTFLGTVFGYFELARPDAVKVEQLVERKQRLLDLLGTNQLTVLDEGRAIVSERLAQLQEERRAKNEQVLAKVDQKQDKAKNAIEGETRRIEVNEQLAESSKEQLREAQRELGVIQMQLAPLTADRAGGIANRLHSRPIGNDSATARAVVAAEPRGTKPAAGPTESALSRQGNFGGRMLPAVIEVDPRVLALNTTLAALSKQAFDMDRRLLALRTRAAELGGKSTGEATTLDQSSAAIRNAEKRTRALEKQVKQLERKSPALKAAVTPEMTRFATYLPFPFDEESQRVLGWFAN